MVCRQPGNSQYHTHPQQAQHADRSQHSSTSQQATYTHNPKFPNLPENTPLTVVLTMAACLSDDPAERPTFVEVSQILTDVRAEVRSGAYIDSHAQPQVSIHVSPFVRKLWKTAALLVVSQCFSFAVFSIFCVPFSVYSLPQGT